jgi:hypothetical protein
MTEQRVREIPSDRRRRWPGRQPPALVVILLAILAITTAYLAITIVLSWFGWHVTPFPLSNRPAGWVYPQASCAPSR